MLLPRVSATLSTFECLQELQLQLNPDKTELIWFGSHANLQKIETTDNSLRIDPNVIHSVVRDLGVILGILTKSPSCTFITSVVLSKSVSCLDQTLRPLLSLRSC